MERRRPGNDPTAANKHSVSELMELWLTLSESSMGAFSTIPFWLEETSCFDSARRRPEVHSPGPLGLKLMVRHLMPASTFAHTHTYTHARTHARTRPLTRTPSRTRTQVVHITTLLLCLRASFAAQLQRSRQLKQFILDCHLRSIFAGRLWRALC